MVRSKLKGRSVAGCGFGGLEGKAQYIKKWRQSEVKEAIAFRTEATTLRLQTERFFQLEKGVGENRSRGLGK